MKENINFFGDPIYSPFEILKTDIIAKTINDQFVTLCDQLMISNKISSNLFLDLVEMVQNNNTSVYKVEREIHIKFRKHVNKTMWDFSLMNRAFTIYNQIFEFIKGTSLLDVGCGDGLVSYLLNANFQKIRLFDIQDYKFPFIKLPFSIYDEEGKIPSTLKSDTTLLITVLHHSADPISLFRKVKSVTSKRCIIIESVIGVKKYNDNVPSVIYDFNKEMQRMYASFWDWFYNRIIHQNVQVTYNYLSPENWASLFKKEGWTVIKTINLGIDQPLVPEHHYLFVIDK